MGERRAEQNDAEIGVATDARPCRFHRVEDARADARARRAEMRRRGFGAGDEVLRLHAMARRIYMDIAGLGRGELVRAGGDESAGDLFAESNQPWARRAAAPIAVIMSPAMRSAIW